LILFVSAGVFCSAQTTYRIAPSSVITIELSSSGLFKFAGHKHQIDAPIRQGSIGYFPSNLEKSSVDLEVASKALRVVDPKADAKERAEVQQTMEGPKVLDVARFPRISFKSRAVRQLGDGRVQLTGDLTLHGITRPVTVVGKFTSSGSRLQATGSCRFKQTDFGMKPVKVGGGTVSVKDEIQLNFRVDAASGR
jgi:polyisoprenoid-binding protein YceI